MGADHEGEMDERPRHGVTLRAFLLDTTEVTNAAYLECVRAGSCAMYDSLQGSRLTNGHPELFHRASHPVVGVSWFDAERYCGWKGKRLPSEAEWERAARGDDDRRYVWGNDDPDPSRHGAFAGRASTAPVGSYPEGKAAFGHLDLAGNVWEWMRDEYDPYAYRRSTAAQGIPGSCEQIRLAQDELRREGQQGFTGKNPIPVECERVLRGGAYNYGASGLRNSNRVHHPASWRLAVAGFRCAKDVDAHASGVAASAPSP
jgi:formylglycine-generating enzyme required for sulfatase activity